MLIPATLPSPAHSSFEPLALMGKSAVIVLVRSQMQRTARYFRTALITGERGTGQSEVALALHALSRQDRLVVWTVSTELERMISGTLYVPELADLPAASQDKLLRLLARGLDVRVIAATVHSPKTLVSAGRLRQDLYAALSTVEIALPSLRSRVEDIPALAATVLGERTMTAEFLSGLQQYPWPGNLDELKEILEEAVGLDGGGLLDRVPVRLQAAPLAEAARPARLKRLQEVVDQHVFSVLSACSGNKLRAAEVLGISRSTLYRMLDASPSALAN